MKRLISRHYLTTLAVAAGAIGFGAFWTTTVYARGAASGPWCPPNTPGNANTNATMCYNGTTVNNVPPSTQSSFLTSGQGSCGACPTSGN